MKKILFLFAFLFVAGVSFAEHSIIDEYQIGSCEVSLEKDDAGYYVSSEKSFNEKYSEVIYIEYESKEQAYLFYSDIMKEVNRPIDVYNLVYDLAINAYSLDQTDIDIVNGETIKSFFFIEKE